MANTKIPSELIADSSITAAKLADGTITTADIADSNVTTAKIADSNVTTAKIGDAQVTTAKIVDANVTTAKIADSNVTTAKIADNNVTTAKLASGLTLAGTTNSADIIITSTNRDSLKVLRNSSNGDAGIQFANTSGNLTVIHAGALGGFTIDTAGDIILDAGGGDWKFKDDGVDIGLIANSSSDLIIQSTVSDKDMIFRGVDGGSTIVALTLDMSAAGAATFNGKITADAGIDIDNINIDGTTISQAGSSDLTIDVGGRIDLSADDNGEVRLYDGSSLYAQFKDDDDRLRIQTLIQDKDMLFVGNDGGSEVTALSLDMSDGGTAIFGNDIKAGSGGKVNADTFNNRANTANIIYRTGSTTVVGNHANALVVADTGNVGINNTSPSSYSGDGNNLVIGTTSGDNGLSIISGTSNSGSIYFGDVEETGSLSRRGQLVYNHSDDSMRVFTASAEKMRIDSTGKVGIGNIAPKALAHIGTLANGPSQAAQEILRLSGDYNGLNSGVQLYFTNQHDSGSNPNTGEYYLAGIKAYDYATDWGGGLALQTAPATSGGGTPVDRLIISPTGDVLVGSSTNLNVLSGTPKIQVGDGSGHSSIQWYSGTSSVAGLYFGDATSGDDRYPGYIEYRHNNDSMAFTVNKATRFNIGSDGYITFTSTRNEYSMELNSAGTRAGLVLNKPGTSSVMGSLLTLSDETYRLGTASNYHIRMDQSGNTYMGNTSTTRFSQNGNLSVNTTTANSGITSGTDVRALGPCFANDANSFTMSQEGTGSTDAYLAARGANGSTRGNIHIGVSVSGGGSFKSGLIVDNQGRSTTPENPAFRYRATAAQVLNSGWQIVGYATLKEERGSNFDTTNSRFTAPVAGWYQFNASWTANSNADTDGTFAICVNGSTTDLAGSVSMPDTSGSYDGHSVSGCCYLDVNDYVDVRRYSSVATTTRSSAPYGGWFSGFLIG